MASFKVEVKQLNVYFKYKDYRAIGLLAAFGNYV